MIQPVFRTLSCAVVVAAFSAISIAAQDFSRDFQLGTDATISVRTVSGNVKVSGYDGEVVTVVGRREGRDRELVTIVDRSTADRVDIGVKYPEECNCDATVHFEVRIPRKMRYRYDAFSTVSGDVAVADINGDLVAKSVSGRVTVTNVSGQSKATSVSGQVIVENAAGAVTAKSTSGEVRVTINRLDGMEPMEFTSVSGSVHVTLPSSLDANVDMSVLSGDLKTDFPLQIEDKGRGPGRKATGQVGRGGRPMRLSSVSGSVSLLKQ